MNTITIPGRLPGTNEIIEQAKQHWSGYARTKRRITGYVALLAKQLTPVESARISIEWYERNRKRDVDNVMGGQKFILDGLVAGGVIQNDSQRYVTEITHRFFLDRANPRIVVTVEAV